MRGLFLAAMMLMTGSASYSYVDKPSRRESGKSKEHLDALRLKNKELKANNMREVHSTPHQGAKERTRRLKRIQTK